LFLAKLTNMVTYSQEKIHKLESLSLQAQTLSKQGFMKEKIQL